MEMDPYEPPKQCCEPYSRFIALSCVIVNLLENEISIVKIFINLTQRIFLLKRRVDSIFAPYDSTDHEEHYIQL